MLTGGQVHDSIMMKPVLDQLDISQSVILADKAYGSAENRKYISDRGAQYCIPPKEGLSKPWKCDYFHYKERHLVECFFMKIKDYRRVEPCARIKQGLATAKTAKENTNGQE